MSEDSPLKRRLILKIGAGAVALVVPMVGYFEGTVLRTYRDPIGIITSCRGHVDSTLRMGQKFTEADCDEQEYQDLLKHADDLNCIKAPLTDYQRAALLSFSFNVGPGQAGKKDGLCVLKSGEPTTVVRKFNAGDAAGGCAALSSWIFAGGHDCRLPQYKSTCGGLVQRRAIERAVCEGGPVVVPS